jgi:hypothetical protein
LHHRHRNLQVEPEEERSRGLAYTLFMTVTKSLFSIQRYYQIKSAACL